MSGDLAALTAPFAIAAPGVAALEVLLGVLAEDETAPTTVRVRERALHAHVGDALGGLLVPELAAATRVADLGAGAGVPGLVLAAARPEMLVTEVESVGRKCAFMERAIASMGLRNAEVVCERAESWREGFGRCDAVTARALAPLPVVVEYAAPLLREGGVLVAWKGRPEPAEISDGEAAAALLGLSPARIVPMAAQPGADRRSLYVYLKVRSLPNGYPRRPGMARKRPIRASSAG